MAEVIQMPQNLMFWNSACNPLNVSGSASSKKQPRPVYDWVIIKIPNGHKGQRISNKYREALLISPKVLEMKQFALRI